MAKKKAPSKRQQYKVGQIVAIPLPDHKFAYAKVFNEFDLGVYDFLSDEIEPLSHVVKKKILYFNGVTDRAIKDGTFIVIGEEPFPDEESAWAPPMASGVFPGDDDLRTLHIDHKGVSRKATPQEAAGMYIRGFFPRPEIFVKRVVDRLVNGNNRKYRVKV
jgi:hypothetical protein